MYFSFNSGFGVGDGGCSVAIMMGCMVVASGGWIAEVEVAAVRQRNPHDR